MTSHWQPTASLECIEARAKLLASIRSFFSRRQIMEVETPLLSSSTALDPYLCSFALDTSSGTRYLQTSPEFAMKRLLAAGTGAIYQICKAFRAGESGRLHNPEFTMLEWYRPGFSLTELMDEVEALVSGILGERPFLRSSYREIFECWYGVNPHNLGMDQLRTLALKHGSLSESDLEFRSAELQRTFFLDLLISHGINEELEQPMFIYDFPAPQAALSVTSKTSEGDLVARRFELYLQGMELANGYLELRESEELVRRLRVDNEHRCLENLPELPLAPELVDAMLAGLPDCCGVALGVDRLLMLQVGSASLEQVISFPFNNA